MAIEMVTSHDCYVFRDDTKTWRWYDAIGPNVIKWEWNAAQFNVGDSNGNPVDCTTTEVGTNTIIPAAGATGGRIVITTGATENNGLEAQALGEAFKLDAGKPMYFGAKFAGSDVDQSDFIAGIAITDTTTLAGSTYMLAFRSADESALVYLVLEKNTAETLACAHTMSDNVYLTAEFYWDGVDTVTAYYDGVSGGTITSSDGNWFTSEYMTPTIGILSGATGAKTLTLEWARCIQLR